MVNGFLVPDKTVITAKGDGTAINVSGAAHPVFLLTLAITDIVEQESLDVSIYGSSDGTTWNPKPLISFPQKFYRGQHPLLLNLKDRKEVQFVRAHWEVYRWGRGSPTPSFAFSVSINEVPPEILQEAAGEAKALI
jgi:hypothetical protein